MKLSRLHGALLLVDGDHHFLIGDLKEPCDFAAAGFEDPGKVAPLERAVLPLRVTGSVDVRTPWLDIGHDGAGEDMAEVLVRRFVIPRNGSVSNRLWNLVLDESPTPDPNGRICAHWIIDVPDGVWDIIRNTILRC